MKKISLKLPELLSEKHEFYCSENKQEDFIMIEYKKNTNVKKIVFTVPYYRILIYEFIDLYKLLVNKITEMEKLFLLEKKITFLVEQIKIHHKDYIYMEYINNILLYLDKIVFMRPSYLPLKCENYPEDYNVQSKFEKLEIYSKFIVDELKILFYKNKVII